MMLTPAEEAALAGEHGEVMRVAHRILVATGEATGAERLVPVQWVHLSGVNYNTIGDAGEEFLRSIRDEARVRVPTTLNPMGYDVDNAKQYGITDEFMRKQQSIQDSYEMMGVRTSFTCIPYDVHPIPERGTQVAFAESNAAIHANSLDGLRTNKESAFSALASALTGKSPDGGLRRDTPPDATVTMAVPDPTELEWGMLGYFAGRVCDAHAAIPGRRPDARSCKALCGGMGTSGTCGRFSFGASGGERVEFDVQEAREVRDELNTAEDGDIIVLGSPQLSYKELVDLTNKLRGRRFTKECMVFCPRTAKDKAVQTGHAAILERAGCSLLADCCACLSPLITAERADSVITNSIKGAYYMGKSGGVGVRLKPLNDIVRDHTA